MPNIFDTSVGEIHVNNQVTFRAGSTPQELRTLGLMFDREIDMKTGWVFRTIGSQSLANHVVQFSLGFEAEALKRMSFSFAENPAREMDDLFKEHNRFLYQEIGVPNEQNTHQALYQFVWGEIVSEIDPRNGSAYIQVTWS
jgi:hypothetical protein